MSTIPNMITLALAAISLPLAQGVPYPLSPRAATNTSTNNSSFELIADYSGSNFFNNFVTFTGTDPTNGHVNYTDMAFAAQNGYVGYVYNATSNTSSAYIGVDHTNQAPNGRNSVRLISKQTFNAGSMVVVDLNHIPVQYGLWPAVWLLGSGKVWPAAGESDILEYVHTDTFNAMTLHSAPGCSVSNTTSAFQGHLKNINCNTGDGSTGCSVAAYDQLHVGSQKFPTAGFALNKIDGGVYVHNWQDDGITVWMFPHGHLPADLVAGRPNPASWKQKPLAKFSGDCDFATAFQDMQLIINIDFCGSWAGAPDVWQASGAVAKTGASTCEEYVTKNPKAFKDSYFDIQSVKFYTNNGQKPGKGPTTFSK